MRGLKDLPDGASVSPDGVHVLSEADGRHVTARMAVTEGWDAKLLTVTISDIGNLRSEVQARLGGSSVTSTVSAIDGKLLDSMLYGLLESNPRREVVADLVAALGLRR